MNNPEESGRKPAHTQKLVMAAFLVALVVTVIMYSSFIFGSEDHEEIAEMPQMEENAPLPPPPPAVELRPMSPPNPDADEEVFMVVENMPTLIGGLGSIQQNIRYPEQAKESGIEGRVFIQFIVDEHGNVQDPVVVRGIGGGCDEEAVRAVSKAKFEPGRQRGKAVKVKMSLPITFKLA